MKKIITTSTELASTSLGTVESVASRVTGELDKQLSPVRKNFAERFPILFSLLATVGVVATFLGLEQLLLTANLLERYPVLILALGVSLLIFTGTLYKKR